jgi:hypothetical protein
MSSFVPAILDKPVPHDVVLSLGAIQRGQGKQDLYKEHAYLLKSGSIVSH